MIALQDIAYVRSGAADLKEAVRFAVDIVGLELVGEENGTAYLRADERHHCLALVEGVSGVLATAFTLADSAALAAAEEELELAGVKVARGSAEQARARRVQEYLSFDDPFGNRIELVVGQVQLARPLKWGRPAGITEFGHLCVDAADVREAHRFWSSLFNMRVSDWIGDKACLMRIDEVHHKFAVFKGDRPGMCHMNFQVESLDDVMRNWHFLESQGVEIERPGPPPAVHRRLPLLQGSRGLHLRVLVGRPADHRRRGLATADLRPQRAGRRRHVARPDQHAHRPAAARPTPRRLT